MEYYYLVIVCVGDGKIQSKHYFSIFSECELALTEEEAFERVWGQEYPPIEEGRFNRFLDEWTALFWVETRPITREQHETLSILEII
jgi:hypothetical protein